MVLWGRLAARICMRRTYLHHYKTLSAPFCTDENGGQSGRVKIFDREFKRKQRDRAAWLMKGKDQFVDSVAENLLDRLEDCKKTFPTALCLGGSLEAVRRLLRGRGAIEKLIMMDMSLDMVKHLESSDKNPSFNKFETFYFVGDEEFLPIKESSIDLVVSCLGLHWTNDLPGSMIQSRLALKPDGLFLAAILGGETLKELRIACTIAQMEREGGVSPRISPLAQVRDAGNLLTRAGFTLPGVDVDEYTIRYNNALELIEHLRTMGETNALLHRNKLLKRETALATAAVYESMFAADDGTIPATFQVIYMTGWKEHPSQQRAKRRGSATVSFEDIQKHFSTYLPVKILRRPTPATDELLVKVEAASLNPADWKKQKDMQRLFHTHRNPFTPVTDVAGEVAAVGSGMTTFKHGDKVVSMLPLTTSGGLAEYCIAPVNMTVIRPPELSAAEGSGLCTAALAALQALKLLGVKLDATDRHRNILITAASGGVGHYAVQLAKLGNFHITATCGNRNTNLVRGLGADEVIDYTTSEGESLKSPSGKKYDCVINCAEGISWSKNIKPNLAASGIAIYTVPETRNRVRAFGNTFSDRQLKILKMKPNNEDLKFLVGLAKEGKIRTVVDSTFPFSNAKEAWQKSMDGHATGKIIVEVPGVE